VVPDHVGHLKGIRDVSFGGAALEHHTTKTCSNGTHGSLGDAVLIMAVAITELVHQIVICSVSSPFWSAVQGLTVSLDEGEFGWEVSCFEMVLESSPFCQSFVLVAEHSQMTNTIVVVDVNLELEVAVLSKTYIHMHSVARSRGSCVGMIRQSFCARLSHSTRCAVGVSSLLQAK
jgi:hypothetical protein